MGTEKPILPNLIAEANLKNKKTEKKYIEEYQIAPLPPTEKTVFLFAHPDDETLFAGTIADISRNRRKTHSYYATLGEKGMTNNVCSPDKLAEVRLNELAKAETILGFTQVITPDPKRLTLHDGQLPDEFDRLTTEILGVLRDIKPDRVITFPPSGITGHPDHQMMLLAGWKAFQNYYEMAKKDNQFPLSIEFLCRVVPPWARGIEGAEKHSNLIHPDKKLVPTHYVDVRPHADKIRQVLEAHQTQRPALSTIYPILRQENPLIHENEYYWRAKLVPVRE